MPPCACAGSQANMLPKAQVLTSNNPTPACPYHHLPAPIITCLHLIYQNRTTIAARGALAHP